MNYLVWVLLLVCTVNKREVSFGWIQWLKWLNQISGKLPNETQAGFDDTNIRAASTWCIALNRQLKELSSWRPTVEQRGPNPVLEGHNPTRFTVRPFFFRKPRKWVPRFETGPLGEQETG